MAPNSTTQWFRIQRLLRWLSAAVHAMAVVALLAIPIPWKIAAFAILLVIGAVTTYVLLSKLCPNCGSSFTGSLQFGFWPPLNSFRTSCPKCGASAEEPAGGA